MAGATSPSAARGPILIAGMHRSGTSMLTRMLQKLGLHVGMDCRSEQSESRFFQDQNIRLFEESGARWDSPRKLRRELQSKAGLDRLYHSMLQEMSDADSSCYSGGSCGGNWQTLTQRPQPWGWKDPRNSFTWPLWMRLFPDARMIVVYRNGVDVAQSLRRRALKEASDPESGDLRWVFIKQWLPKYRCMSAQYGFRLWTDYVEENIEAASKLGSAQFRAVRFEDLLDEPVRQLGAVARFAGLECDEARLAKAAREADTNRAHAFQHDSAMARFYNRNANHPLMKQLGYDEL